MENNVYQLFFVLCRPNELTFTQLIAVTFTTVRPVTSILQQGGTKITFFRYNIECMQQPPGKK